MHPLGRFSRFLDTALALLACALLFFTSTAGAATCSLDTLESECPASAPAAGAGPEAGPAAAGEVPDGGPQSLRPVTLQMFYSHDCPHCHEALEWLPQLERRFPNLVLQTYEVKGSAENRRLFESTAADHRTEVRGVPTFFVGGESIVGFYSDQTCAALLEKVRAGSGLAVDEACERSRELTIPILGTVRADRISLPQLTVVLGLLDSLNPCAMWVLTFLLSILVHSRSRRRTLMVGGVFVVASGLVYFAFMAAWLNLFLVIGMHRAITVALAGIAIGMGLINMKELFFFKKGVSLMIPESAKPMIAERVRRILREKSTLVTFASTAMLALFANFVELGCTVGFPAIFTKVLAQRELGTLGRYGYMALYNAVYVVPLALIVTGFALTMGRFSLSERQAKGLKLVSGAVMLALGLVMLLAPELLAVS